jgi:hypothetical protein
MKVLVTVVRTFWICIVLRINNFWHVQKSVIGTEITAVLAHINILYEQLSFKTDIDLSLEVPRRQNSTNSLRAAPPKDLTLRS